MTSSKRGIFVIISNEHFQPQTQFQPRPGAQHDRDTLTQLFVRLGFDVRVHQNVTANKACQILARGLLKHTDSDQWRNLKFCPPPSPPKKNMAPVPATS